MGVSMEGIVNPVAQHQSQVEAAFDCVAEYRKIVNVVIRFRGVTAWERDVYVFDVTNGDVNGDQECAYAWSHRTSEDVDTDDSDEASADADPVFTTMIDGERVTDATTAVHEALRQRFGAETPVLPASA